METLIMTKPQSEGGGFSSFRDADLRHFNLIIPQRDYWHGGHFCVFLRYNILFILSHEVLEKLEKLIKNLENINAKDNRGKILNSHNSGGTRHGPLQNDGARGSLNFLPQSGEIQRGSGCSSNSTVQVNDCTPPSLPIWEGIYRKYFN